MARITKVQLIDDLDGKTLDDAVTLRWGLDGKEYEFDTSEKNADTFRRALDKYVAASRGTGRATANRRAAASESVSRPRDELQAIRDWANSNGYEVSNRGRIPNAVVEAFEAAH